MNVRQMAILLDREAFVQSPDGLVPCVVRDVKVQYGATRLRVEVATCHPINGVFLKATAQSLVDAARVYFPSAAQPDLLVPTAEVVA